MAATKEQSSEILETARFNIKMACTLRDMNMAQVSVEAGMSRNAVSQFCTGKSTLSYLNMLSVCEVLQIPISIVHQPDSITKTNVAIWNRVHRLSTKELERALKISDAVD